MKPTRIEVFSPLPPEECAERIRAAIDADWRSSGFFGHKSVTGNVSGSSLRLYVQGGWSSSYKTWFFGVMRPVPGGTVLSGRFGMHPVALGFTLTWFAALIVLGGTTVAENTRALVSGDGGDIVPVVGIPLTLLAGIALTLGGRYVARDEAASIRAFIVREVQGREPKRAA